MSSSAEGPACHPSEPSARTAWDTCLFARGLSSKLPDATLLAPAPCPVALVVPPPAGRPFPQICC